MFSSLADLEKFATKSLDVELQGKIKIVRTYHHNLPTIIAKIRSKCVRDDRQAGRGFYGHLKRFMPTLWYSVSSAQYSAQGREAIASFKT